jgi:hypothetical protein
LSAVARTSSFDWRSREYREARSRTERGGEHEAALRRAAETFWAGINKVRGGCWYWTGGTRDGYGRVVWNGRYTNAHRVAWMLKHGPIPEGARVRHVCPNRACVRPDHLSRGAGSAITASVTRSAQTVEEQTPDV